MKHFGYVLAPKILVTNKLKVRFMYRETSDDKSDSGWRFFSGTEDQDYMDNPNNIEIYSIETILAIDQDIKPYLKSKFGSAFERVDSNKPFVPSKDYNFGSDL